MRTLLVLLALLFIATPTAAQQVDGLWYPPLLWREEGTDVGRSSRAVNCSGSPITCTNAAGVTTITVAAGGSGNTLEVSLTISDAVVGLIYTTTVTGQSWVTSSSKIVCASFADGAGSTPIELTFASGQHAIVSNRVAGTGFDLTVFNPHGAAGTFKYHCSGA